MSSNTPNLKLLKKDPASDGNDTFNIKEMLNDNWDKTDAKFGASTGHGHTGIAGDGPKITADGLGNGSASDTVIGNRTIADTTAPTGDTGTITNLLGWLANMIKSITGKSSWRTAPATTLEAAKTHADDTTRHLTAAERLSWNAKETTAGAQAKADAVQTNLTAHTGNATVHITAAERTAWNAKADASQLGRVDLTQTLGPGTSVVTADSNGSELDMTVNGRTLLNPLGTYGDGESLTGWTLTSGNVSVSTTQKRSGISSIKSVASASHSLIQRDFTTKLDITKQYLLAAWAYVESYTSGPFSIRLFDTGSGSGGTRYSANVNTSIIGSWQLIYVKVPTANTITTDGFRVYVGTGSEATGVVYFDEVRIYEVTSAEYSAIGTTIINEAIDAYFPHVSGKQHVQGVAVTKQGRNLLPAIPAEASSTVKQNGPYDLTLTSTANYQGVRIANVDALPNTAYTLSATVTNSGSPMYSYLNIYSVDSAGLATYVAEVGAGTASTLQLSKTITTPANCVGLRINITNTGAGTGIFKNWQLELGSTATLFTPAEPQSVILPVTLGQVGDVRDSVYSAGTEWMYVERVKKNVVLDGTLSWSYILNGTNTRYVIVNSSTFPVPARLDVAGNHRAIKYDGLPLLNQNAGNFNANLSNSSWSAGSTGIGLVVANTDSGWIDAINPSNNAIKALMNGWKAVGNDGTAYNSWVSLLDGSTPATNTSTYTAANKAPNWTGWATMDYALASSAVPVTIPNAEGSITLHPGGNQINVETGLIQREKVVPKLDSSWYYIVSQSSGSYWGKAVLSHPTRTILGIFKGADNDTRNWTFTSDGLGAINARILPTSFDSAADYYVSYIALDKYALTANVTETAATWRTGLGGVVSDLVQSTAELRQENDRQDFADDYIEAKIDNLKFGIADASALPDTIQKYKLTEKTGVSKAHGSTDFNNILQPGEYTLNGSSMQNGPVATPSGYLKVRAIDATNVIQEITLTPTFIGWSRRITGGVWNTWIENENANKKNVAGGFAGLDTGANVSVDNLPHGGVINMLGDSGKFVGPEYDPKAILCPATFVNNSIFSMFNGTTVAGAGKFIHDNTNYGGTNGTMTSDVTSLLTAMAAVTGPSSTRYGPEYHVAAYTQGPGTSNVFTLNSVNYYLSTVNNNFPAAGVGKTFTMSFWIRLKSGTGALIVKPTRLRKNGVTQASHVALSVADGWVHIEALIGAGSGYSNSAPNLYAAAAGDIIQIALPVVTQGGIGVGVHTGPVMGANLGFVPLPLSAYTPSDVLSKLLTVDGVGSGLDADLHAGKTLAEVVQGSLSFAVTSGTAPALVASITPAPAVLSAGLRVTIKAHAATTGPVTLNLNGLGAKSVKKPNGNNPPLVLGGVYTLVYDGTNFILQGEGGEYGTAATAQVLAGYSIGTEYGLIAGTMVDRSRAALGAGYATALSIKGDTSGNVVMEPPTGYYTSGLNAGGFGSLLANDAGFRPVNYLPWVTMFGQVGTMPVKGPDTADQLAAVNATAGAGVAYLGITPNNYYSGINWIRFYDNNLQPGNIRSGVSLFNGGIVGTLVPDTSGVLTIAYSQYFSGTGSWSMFAVPACKNFVFGGSASIGSSSNKSSNQIMYMWDDAGHSVVALDLNTSTSGSTSTSYFRFSAADRKLYRQTWGDVALPANFNVNGALSFTWACVEWNSASSFMNMSGFLMYG